METARQTTRPTAHPAAQQIHPAAPVRSEPAPSIHGPVGVLPWPDELLGQFGLRMASHGMSISRTQMRGSAGYALQQMAHARALGDATLELLVVQLFRCYEAHQSGVHPPSH